MPPFLPFIFLAPLPAFYPVFLRAKNYHRRMDTPPPLPPLFRDQRKIDADHLRVLSICHYVGAGLNVLVLGFIGLHYMLVSRFIIMAAHNSHAGANPRPGPSPVEIFAILKWVHLFAAAFLLAYGIANLLSAWFIQKRQHRVFSLVMSGFNCIRIPLGTALGVCTIIVLTRDSVRELYDAKNAKK